MDLLHELASDGAEEGTVVVACEQTSGRGSRGRVWRSPPGGLWLSALYRPAPPAAVELLSLRVGLAVAEALEAVGSGLRVAIKWPNDLIVDDRKLGGILCEARWHGEALAWIVAGVGLNVTNAIPAELAAGATRLADRLPDIHPEALEPHVIVRLRALDASGDRLEQAELAALRERDWLRGRRVARSRGRPGRRDRRGRCAARSSRRRYRAKDPGGHGRVGRAFLHAVASSPCS